MEVVFLPRPATPKEVVSLPNPNSKPNPLFTSDAVSAIIGLLGMGGQQSGNTERRCKFFIQIVWLSPLFDPFAFF